MVKDAERQQDEWIRLFGGSDELRAIQVLHALADIANARHAATSGEVGIIAVEAVLQYDHLGGSAAKTNEQLRARYRSGHLKNILGQPLKGFLSVGAVSAIGMSALMSARPESEAEIREFGPQDYK